MLFESRDECWKGDSQPKTGGGGGGGNHFKQSL